MVSVREAPEFPRREDAARPKIQVKLIVAGGFRGQHVLRVSIPISRQPPDILKLVSTGKLYVRRDSGAYTEAVVWPIIEEDEDK